MSFVKEEKILQEASAVLEETSHFLEEFKKRYEQIMADYKKQQGEIDQQILGVVKKMEQARINFVSARAKIMASASKP